MGRKLLLDAQDYEDLKQMGFELEDPSTPIPGESEWSQQHRMPFDAPERVQKISDEDLLALVEERLDYHPDLKRFAVEVQVSKGVVTLRGKVTSDAAKLQAIELIEALPGVTDIHSELRSGR